MVELRLLTNNMDSEQISTAKHDFRQCLLNLAHHKNKNQFLVLYDHFAPRLKTHLMQKGAHNEMAEELVQETMLAVWRHCGSYDPDKSAASTWIFRIARNQWIDRLRRDKSNLTTSLENHAETGFTPSLAPMDADRLKAALDALPQHQAQLVYKVYYEGKTHREIALDMDIPLGSVKSGLRLAFTKLRSHMGGES